MKRTALAAGIMAFLFVSPQSYAQERTTIIKEILGPKYTARDVAPADKRFEIGVGSWLTTGRLDSFVYSSSEWLSGDDILRANRGDTISQLQYKLPSKMTIIDIGAHLLSFLYVDASIGLGQVRGQQKDYDWYPQERYEARSLYDSSADGNTMTWDANAELRCVDWNNGKSFVDLSLGYLYYRDSVVHLHDTTTVIDQDYQPSNTPLAGHDSQDKYTFDGFRIGSRCRWEVFDRIAFKGRVGVIPWMNAINKGYWNLRQTQFLGTSAGTAVDLMGGFEFRITKNFFIEAGYKYMYFKSYKGMQRTRGIDSEEWSEIGFSAQAQREGFYLKGNLKM